MKIRLGVIGCGYFGPSLVRHFSENPESEVSVCCDLDPERLSALKPRFPYVTMTQDYKEILRDPGVDAVVIATPVSTHYHLAKEALESGKHVLVEKPMTAKVSDAEDLIETAEKRGLVLMVDHTLVYKGAVKKIKEIIDSGTLGEIYYFDAVRVNLGLFQQDVNVLWDLAPHDLSVMDYLLDRHPISVSAVGSGHFHPDIENIAYLTVKYEENLLGHIHVNWLAPSKIRLTLIGGSKKMIVHDDMEISEKVRVYDCGVVMGEGKEGIYKTRIQYRMGDMLAPKWDQTDALKVECGHFLECIREGKRPLTDGIRGLNVVRILEAAEKSLRNDGKVVKL